jgi:hypothetical protein
MGASVLGELPLVSSVSASGDLGVPVVLASDSAESEAVKEEMSRISSHVYEKLSL